MTKSCFYSKGEHKVRPYGSGFDQEGYSKSMTNLRADLKVGPYINLALAQTPFHRLETFPSPQWGEGLREGG